MRRNIPKDWRKYPLRMCYTLHHCVMCQELIKVGEHYYDGGREWLRSHYECAEKARAKDAEQQQRQTEAARGLAALDAINERRTGGGEP